MKVIELDEVRLNGKYLITDPCYVYGDKWDKFCDLLWDHQDDIIVFNIDGGIIPVMSTAYGDGYYLVYDLDGKEVGGFGVDAGLFAIIPTEDDNHSDGPFLHLSGKLTYENGNAYVDGKLAVDTRQEVTYEW